MVDEKVSADAIRVIYQKQCLCRSTASGPMPVRVEGSNESFFLHTLVCDACGAPWLREVEAMPFR